MKFRLKITLSILCLVALLFGAGGSLLVALSFDSSLERQEASARESHQLILDTMSAVSALDVWTSSNDVSSLLDKLHADSVSSWSALRLSSADRVIHESGGTRTEFIDDRTGIDQGHSATFSVTDGNGQHYLQLSGACVINGEQFYLDALQDITPLYETRDHQLAAFHAIFLVLMVCCALCAYVISWLLTRPLTKLSRAARELASGNLSYRSNVRTNDEIGNLSADFDAMARQVEQSVTDMQQTLARQERFMGSFAHEVKTPMTSIIGYADLMRRDVLGPDERIEAAEYLFSEASDSRTWRCACSTSS
ncbi:HAMP domain-containing protein [Eggerthella sinensis]|uniref:HAMP domain-containing protein n=1 Tax=Eggerthella sinensis TaxID=242230 RepID=UPI0022E98681|nr:HAMP domain-containing protein [Eggerthella sinensis]